MRVYRSESEEHTVGSQLSDQSAGQVVNLMFSRNHCRRLVRTDETKESRIQILKHLFPFSHDGVLLGSQDQNLSIRRERGKEASASGPG